MSESEGTVLGIPQNTEASLCYVFGFISGFVFLLVEKDNRFVRFHAMQSLVTFLGLFVITASCHVVPIFGWVIYFLSVPLHAILWLLLMLKAYSGERYKLPIAGDFAEHQLAAR